MATRSTMAEEEMFGGPGHLRNVARNTRFVRLRKTRRIHPPQPDWPIFVIMPGPIVVFGIVLLLTWILD